MTASYTHTSQAAARLAVTALPSVMDNKVKAIKADPESTVNQIKAIASALTPANLAENKAALLALLAD